MSGGHQFVAMDFSGIEKSKKKASEIKYPAPGFHEKSIHWIKPLMVQQAFSSNAPRDHQNPKFEVPSGVKKELFPQHTGRGSNPTAEQKIESFGNSSIARSAHTTPPGKQSAAQLTIFYNGIVNVYDVSEKQAEDIIRLAGNEISSQQLQSAGCDRQGIGKPITISSTSTSSQTEEPLLLNPSKYSNPQQVVTKKLHTDLPLQRNQSLQRFLQNRKGCRKNRATPYSESHAAKH